MTDAEWVKLRLPNGVSFSKNGVTISVDDMVTGAIADYISKVEAARKYYAVADLLEIVLSDTESDGEREGDYHAGMKRKAILADIERYRREGDEIESGDEDAGQAPMASIPLERTLGSIEDDYEDDYKTDDSEYE